MLKEFKEFAFKGNLIDMAVGIIIGGAFATVIKSLVSDVFMPPLGMVLGKVDFTKMKTVLQPGVDAVKDGEKVVTEAVPEVAINYGAFITEFISFTMLAFVVFIVIKKVVGGMQKAEVAAPAAPPAQEVLLEEIRDLLKK
ncbi:large-conductance mechanosensitive channel protein MscL [bacterium]|nr:large-conductance mechanosensitive channel protein MscL [Akkermansiaceae bacterium]MDA7514541.1 large-conductance mechanosensitive channel protein MscL [bacterium]MDA7519859.1 large-conductance mechanosensitive channel protein MscL [bacterium]MDA7675220.1 large-conductance mechanosensitive channel protein MscL [Akkermansiaceae bacterium]MDA7684492.1 large-conductance mechanosensitive channel protein MscL [Akkermansiaceae bacterium]